MVKYLVEEVPCERRRRNYYWCWYMVIKMVGVTAMGTSRCTGARQKCVVPGVHGFPAVMELELELGTEVVVYLVMQYTIMKKTAEI